MMGPVTRKEVRLYGAGAARIQRSPQPVNLVQRPGDVEETLQRVWEVVAGTQLAQAEVCRPGAEGVSCQQGRDGRDQIFSQAQPVHQLDCSPEFL